MKIIRPFGMVDANLVSSTISEADATEWDSTTAFTIGQTCMVTTTANGAATATHGIYTAQGSTTGDDPTTDDGTNWERTGWTNLWKMFNDVKQEQSTRSDSITVVIEPGTSINSLALLNIEASEITVEVADSGGGVIFDSTYDLLSDSGINTWYDYFYEPIGYDDTLLLFDLPSTLAPTITVTLTNTGGTAKCGLCILGNIFEIGETQYGAGFGITDYSTKSTDANGNVTLSQGAFKDIGDMNVVIRSSRFTSIKKELSDIRATPIVWIVEETIFGTVIFGYYRNFTIVYSDYTISNCLLQIEGL